jgi:hypothetical protein
MGIIKPLVQAACICENVLLDKDGVASLIRIIDQISVEIPEGIPKAMRLQAGFPIQIFVRIGSGDLIENGTLSIHGVRPDGTRHGKIEAKVELKGAQHGTQVRSGFTVVDPQRGIYWFEVYWNNDLLTKMPLEVKLAAPPNPNLLAATPNAPS